jgi:hypothetical protein
MWRWFRWTHLKNHANNPWSHTSFTMATLKWRTFSTTSAGDVSTILEIASMAVDWDSQVNTWLDTKTSTVPDSLKNAEPILRTLDLRETNLQRNLLNRSQFSLKRLDLDLEVVLLLKNERYPKKIFNLTKIFQRNGSVRFLTAILYLHKTVGLIGLGIRRITKLNLQLIDLTNVMTPLIIMPVYVLTKLKLLQSEECSLKQERAKRQLLMLRILNSITFLVLTIYRL